MPKRTFTAKEISQKLGQADRLMDDGVSLADAAGAVNIQRSTLSAWRNKYGQRPDADVIITIQRLEVENARLRRAIAELEGGDEQA
jgi:transposase-like protein